MGIIETEDGLVVFNIALKQYGPRNFKALRNITQKPIKYVIYSHGHFDHCFGFKAFTKEIEEKGWEKPRIIAHRNIVKRFEKYQMLDGYHKWLNAQQFGSVMGKQEEIVSPHDVLEPTTVT